MDAQVSEVYNLFYALSVYGEFASGRILSYGKTLCCNLVVTHSSISRLCSRMSLRHRQYSILLWFLCAPSGILALPSWLLRLFRPWIGWGLDCLLVLFQLLRVFYRTAYLLLLWMCSYWYLPWQVVMQRCICLFCRSGTTSSSFTLSKAWARRQAC